jgi:hypothetical protein
LIAGIAALSMVAYCGIVEGVLPTALQAMLWLGGGVVVAWALSGGFDTETQRHRENTKAQRHKGAKKFFSLLLTPHSLLFLLALTLRLWDLEYAVYTPALELDQVQGVVWLRDDLHRGLLQPYLYNSVPALYPFVQRVTSLVVGANYTALRLVSAVIGALTIPALYELLRTLLLRGLIRDERSAIPLVGALLLACFPPHLHFSRLGMIHIAAPLFGTLALALWARALQNGDRRAAAYGGLALGLTPYFFPFGLLVFPLLCAALWIVFLSRGSMRRWLMLSGVFAAAALAWSAPLLYVQQTRGALPAQESSDGLLTLEHLLRTEETFIVASPTYGGDQALLVAALLPFVLAGFAVACADRRLWVLALWGIGAVITPFTSSAGLTLAFPALSALAALGIGRALPLVGVQNQHKDTTAQWHNGFVFQAAPYIVVLLLGITQVSDYFGRHLALFNEQIRPVFDPYDAMQRARAYPPRTWVQIVGSMEFSGWLSILRAYWEMPGDVYIVRPEDFTLSYLQRIPRDWDVVFFVTPGDTAAQQLIGDWYIAPRVIEPAPSNVPARRRYRQIEVDTPYD